MAVGTGGNDQTFTVTLYPKSPFSAMPPWWLEEVNQRGAEKMLENSSQHPDPPMSPSFPTRFPLFGRIGSGWSVLSLKVSTILDSPTTKSADVR